MAFTLLIYFFHIRNTCKNKMFNIKKNLFNKVDGFLIG